MKKVLVGLVLFLLSLPIAVFAQNQNTYNTLVFFGDSLTDNGNLYNFSLGIIPKSPPYFKGRFSNGATWAELVADNYKTRYNYESANYAVGGETTYFHNPFDGFLPYTFSESIDHYLFRNAFYDKSHSLFFIWIGANDYLPQKNADETISDKVVSTITDNIERLIANDGKNFLIVNLPDLAKTPEGRSGDTQTILAALTSSHNKKIADAVIALRNKHPDINIQFFNVSEMFDAMVENPEKFNQKYHVHITDTMHSCWEGGFTLQQKRMLQQSMKNNLIQQIKSNPATKNIDAEALSKYIASSPSLAEAYQVGAASANGSVPCPNQDEYIFWDHVHPSAVAQYLLSKAFVEFIDQHYTAG